MEETGEDRDRRGDKMVGAMSSGRGREEERDREFNE